MINLAILDDDSIHLENLVDKTTKILGKKNIEFKITQFNDVNTLTDQLVSSDFDIFLLDVKVGDNTTSISLGKKINEISDNAQIIFVTSYPIYFTEVYDCRHVYCILKEELDKRLEDALDVALKNINDSDSNNIVVKEKHNSHILRSSDILYLEKDLRKIKFVMKDKSVIETYASFDDYISDLPKCFVQIHRSFIINANYIKNVNLNYVILLNDEQIPISRTYKKDAMDILLKEYIK